MVINPRGPGGAGKTELVRRILNEYGWRRGLPEGGGGRVRAIQRAGRDRPLAYALEHPRGGRSLVVMGHYEVTSGGCDTIRAKDGGLAEILAQAGAYAQAGHDVLIEGLRLSSEVERSREFARAHGLHVVRLSTPVEQCVRNLLARRRLGRRAADALERAIAAEHGQVEDACTALQGDARVEVLPFHGALARVRHLLALGDPDARHAASLGMGLRSPG